MPPRHPQPSAASPTQVVDQVATTHTTMQARAHDDAGNQAAGADAALTAADELHQAAALLDRVHDRLDAAMSASGRVAWHPAAAEELAVNEAEQTRTLARAGTLTLTIWPATPLGEHQRYAYLVEDVATGQSAQSRDLFTGAGTPVDPDRAMRDLAVYLSAAGEARQYVLDNPGSEPENRALFPDAIAEAARRNADELTDLAENGPTPPGPPVAEPSGTETDGAKEGRWISVVFLQGEEADRVLDIIDTVGTDAAINHLTGYDYGDATVDAALTNGYVYDEPPAGMLDRTATRGEYTMAYNPFLGHVSLLRQYDANPDPVLLGADEPLTVGTTSPRGTAPKLEEADRPRPEASRSQWRQVTTNWFARRPGTTGEGRGLAL